MTDSQQSTATIGVSEPRQKRISRMAGTLGKRNFRLFWIGESTSLIGTNLSSVVLPLVGVRVLHAGTFAVAVLTGSAWLPWLLFGLPAGAWVDRFRKRTVMIACDLVSLLLFGSVAVCAWLGVLTLAQLLIAALLVGIAGVFFKAAFQAYVPQLLPREDLIDGNAKLQASAAFATVSGPGLGGAIAQFLGIAGGVMFDAASFAVSAVCLLGSRPATPEASTKKPKRKFGKEIKEGLQFLLHDTYLLPLALFTSILSLGISSTDSLMIIFYVRTLGASPSVTGIILGLLGAGGLFGAVVSARLVRQFGSARAMLICRLLLLFALLFPLTTRGFGLIFSAGWFMVSIALVSGNVISLSFRQARCPKEMIGRISASYYTVSYSFLALGTVFGGAIGTLIGIRPALWVTCVITASASAVLFFSPIRHLRELPEPATLEHV